MSLPRFCTYCSTPGVTLRCSRCKIAYYCSRECQSNHFDLHHKFDCRNIMRIVNNLENVYIITPNARTTNVLLMILSGLNTDKHMCNIYKQRWEGHDIQIFEIKPELLTLARADARGYFTQSTLVIYETYWYTRRIHAYPTVEYKTWNIDWKNWPSTCACDREIIRIWLLVDHRLQLDLPLEITCMIIQYIVGDRVLHTHKNDRHNIIPLRGPNVYMFNKSFF